MAAQKQTHKQTVKQKKRVLMKCRVLVNASALANNIFLSWRIYLYSIRYFTRECYFLCLIQSVQNYNNWKIIISKYYNIMTNLLTIFIFFIVFVGFFKKILHIHHCNLVFSLFFTSGVVLMQFCRSFGARRARNIKINARILFILKPLGN